MSTLSFQQRCYDLLCQVPAGYVTTYGDLAHAMGNRAYRAIGRAMNQNPNPIIVPCHRVVNADGRVGHYAYGVVPKIHLLAQEGVQVMDGYIVNFAQKRFVFTQNTT